MLVPALVTIVAAGVAIGGGGVGGIGTLTQLVEGPRPPGATSLPRIADDTLAAEPSTLIATRPGRRSSRGSGTGSGGSERRTGSEGDGGGGNRDGGERGGGRGRTSPPGGGGGTVGPAPGGGTTRTPRQTQTPLQGLADTGRRVTDQRPAPVGDLSGEAVDQIVKVGEQVLGNPPREGRTLPSLPR